jgi:hypothetical protein
MSLRARLLEVFALDLRSLALMRVSLALALLFDLALRSANLEAFYSDFGVLPREDSLAPAGPYRICLYLISGDAWFAGLLFALEALALLGVLFGYRTRAALALSLLLHASLVNRNTLVLIGGDNLVCCLLFWLLFLPAHARFSFDAALSTTPPPADNRHRSWASAGLLLQILSVYFFSALLKRGPEWWPDGTAIYYAMSLRSYSTALGQWLLNFPHLLQALSWFVWLLELLALPLALSPLFNRPLRAAVMLLLMAMHTGFLLFMRIVPFPLMSLASLTALAGSGLWDALAARRRAPAGAGLRIYYDRDCAFCLKSCLLLKEFLVLDASIAPAQDTPRARTLLEANYSWVIIDVDDQAYLKWPAFVVLLRRSPLLGWLWPLAKSPRLEKAGNSAYDFVGRHRGAFGSLTAWLWPRREVGFAVSGALQGSAAIFVFALAAWNLTTLLRPQLPPAARVVERVLTPPLSLLRIDQFWNMFAPFPLKDDGWYVLPARLRNGSEIDLRRPETGTVSYDPPASIADSYGDLRWKTYLINLWSQTWAGERERYGRYLCRAWNRAHDHDHQLMTFRMEYMLQATPPPGQLAQVERRIIARHECFPEETHGNVP